MTRDAYLCDALRTPFGRYGGALSGVRADDLAAVPLAALMARNPRVDWQAEMSAHRIAVIGARHQRDRGPEAAHAGEMGVPVLDVRAEYRTEQCVGTGSGIESRDQPLDHCRVDAGAGDDVGGNFGPPFGTVQGVDRHR